MTLNKIKKPSITESIEIGSKQMHVEMFSGVIGRGSICRVEKSGDDLSININGKEFKLSYPEVRKLAIVLLESYYIFKNPGEKTRIGLQITENI